MNLDGLWALYSYAYQSRQEQAPEAGPVARLTARPPDAHGTNPMNPEWGSTDSDLLRLWPDGRGPIGEMSGAERPGAREISNAIVAQNGAVLPNPEGASDFLWMWGQILDHDLSLTPAGQSEWAPIPVPVGDPRFDPAGTGTAIIPFTRVDPGETGYQNDVTAFMDASMIYGSTPETTAEIRVGHGKLMMIEDEFLLVDGEKVFTGDVRAAENVALLSMHTLLTREHNRLVDELAARDPSLTDDQLFDAARARVEAMVQAVTFNEFLPRLIREGTIGGYEGHDPTVNPQISAEFSTAAMRMGHTLLSPNLQLVGEDGGSEGSLALRDAFFRPGIVAENGIDSILRGAATQRAQEFDQMIVEDVRSFLFEPRHDEGGLDLASVNIQRGRDLGIASYNELREAVGLERVTSFEQITSDADLAARLQAVYGDVELVDAWVGGLSEDNVPGGMMGETFARVMVDQFTRLRAGDPMWSEGRGFSQAELEQLWSTRLSDIIARNTGIEIQTDVFQAMERIVGGDVADTMPGTDRADFMLGGAGDDTMGGGLGEDELRGGAGNDVLYGQWGDDTLEGGEGNDVLHGEAGDDVLDGGAGDDMFDAGTGRNVVTGGLGADMFHFDASGAGHTRVTDYEHRVDRLFFSNVQAQDVSMRAHEDGLLLTLDADTAVTFEVRWDGIGLDDFLV